MSKIRHITLPKGFTAAGVACGIKQSGKKDLAIIAADKDVATAMVTTQNQIVGAPIDFCRMVLPRAYGKMRGIVINSGNSNVCTGKKGLCDAQAMATETANLLGCDKEKFLVASTGIIGHPLPMSCVRAGIKDAASKLSDKNDGDALEAIMTTDTKLKHYTTQTTLGRKKTTLAGMVKGSGMIAPSMATMIAVITTDAAIIPSVLHKALKAAVKTSFNAITVDSDTSTSDIVTVFASGQAGNKTITAGSPDFKKFAAALAEVCSELARAVIADGEGANEVIDIIVRGAANKNDAQIAAKAVANSPLFKCAIHGNDPNWGRIAMALGKSSAKVISKKLSISIAGTKVFSGGMGRKFDKRSLSRKLQSRNVKILCDLGQGKGSFTAITCDLSQEYITINADYHT